MDTIKVLLVDDHEGFINAALRHFRKVTWLQVIGTAANGLEAIERYTRQTIVRAEIPTAEAVESRLAEQLIETVSERIAEGNFDDAIAALQPLRDAGHEWDRIAGVLMTLMRESTGREGEEIAEDRSSAPRERREREPRESFEPRPQGGRRERDFKPRGQRDDAVEPGMVKLFLSLGKNHHVSPGDIVGMFHNEFHLESGTVGRIQLFPNFSLVEVAEGEAAHAIEQAVARRSVLEAAGIGEVEGDVTANEVEVLHGSHSYPQSSVWPSLTIKIELTG